jgi:methyl-accepting chemotaxis protein
MRVIICLKKIIAELETAKSEVKGKHHKMFCTSLFYEIHPHFWADLEQGQLKVGRYKMRGKGGSELWLRSTYNTIFSHGKVIKFASGITENVEEEQAGRQLKLMTWSDKIQPYQVKLKRMEHVQAQSLRSK